MKWEGKIKSLVLLCALVWAAYAQRSLTAATIEQSGFQWAKFGGSPSGASGAIGLDMKVDSTGNSYFLANFPANAVFDGNNLSAVGYYLIKLDPDGKLVWKLNLGGSGLTSISPKELLITAEGDIVLAGYYLGTGSIAGQAVSPKGVANSLFDFFLLKIRPDSSVVWLACEDMNVNTPSSSMGVLAKDSAGNIYANTYYNADVTIGGVTFTLSATDGFLVSRYDANGVRQWTRPLPFRGYICCGPGDEFYYAYRFTSSHQWGTEVFTNNGSADIVISRLDAAGNVVWAVQGGGSGSETIRAFGVDTVGNLYMVGIANGSLEFGNASYANAGLTDAFFVSYTGNGVFRWLIPFQGTGNERANDLATDSAGNIHVLLWVQSDSVTVDPELPAIVASDAAVLTFNPAGELLKVANTSGAGFEYGEAVAVGADNLPVLYGEHATGTSVGGVSATVYGPNGGVYVAKVGARRAPSIRQQPVAQAGSMGGTAQFSAVIDASPPYTLQWKKDGEDYEQTTAPLLVISALNLGHAGSYTLVVSNDLGYAESDPVPLYVTTPTISLQAPAATNVWDGQTLRLHAGVSSGSPYAIQWYRNDELIEGATADDLVINNVTIAQEGTYTAMVTNDSGFNLTSAEVRVNFIPIVSHRDMIHDPLRNRLYITASNQLYQFNVTNRTFVTSFLVLGQPSGIDISEDFGTLVMANGLSAGLNSYVITVDLAPPQKTNAVTLTRSSGDFGVPVRSVAFGHGNNLVATLEGFNQPAFWVDTAAKTSSSFGSFRHGLVAGSAGRNVQAITGSQIDPGQFYTVDATSKTVLAGGEGGEPGHEVAMNRDGSHSIVAAAGLARVFDATGALITTLGSETSFPLGVVYHPQSNYLYCTWMDTAEVRVFETETYTQVATIPIATTLSTATGNLPYAPGRLRISADGNQLFCSLPDGIRVINLPLSPPVVLQSPVNEARDPGTSVAFHALASFTPGLQYQWQKDGEDIPNETGKDLVISSVQGIHEGYYRVRVSNTAGFNYSQTAYLNVVRGDPEVVWNTPAAITYGTVLGAAQLNATAVAAGTLTYYPASGTKLNAGNGQVLQVVFEPTDPEAFERVTNSVTIDVQKRLLSVTTINVSRQYGLPNPQFAMNVAGFLAGEGLSDIDVLPVVSSSADATSSPGGYPITISGGSDANYSFTYGSATLSIIKRTVSITLGSLSQAYNGSPRMVSVTTDPPDDVPLSITYNGSTTAPTATGSYAVAVAATGFNYQGNASGTLTIFKDSVPITWVPPADIVYGTALGSGQLNAAAAVSGIYTYTPAAGAILDVGDHTLQLVFTPLDTGNYLRTTVTVPLKVKPRTLTVETIAATREYGAANPTLSGTLSGLQTGEGITVTYGTTANPTSPVGTYAITPTFSDPGNRLFNYNVQVTGDPLTVTKAPLAIKANDVSRSYGTEVTYTAEFIGRKNGDQIPITLSSTATAASAPGTYPITVSLDDADGMPASNYTINLLAGVLTVTVDPDGIVIFSPGALSYVEHSGAQLLDTVAFVTNVFEMSSAVMQLRIINGQAQEQLQLLAEGSGAGEIDLNGNTVRESGVPIATVSGSGGSGETVLIQFGAAATMEQATKVLRRVAYINTSGNPNPNRVVEVRLADINGGISDPATRDIAITLVNDAPQVSWIKPVPGGELKGGYPVVLEVGVTDADDAVSKVEFWINDEKVSEKTAPPYRHSWTPTTTGTVVFKVVATDVTGDTTESDAPGNPYAILPAIATPRFEVNNPGSFRFDFIAPNGQEYDVEVSADLVTWIKLTTVTAQPGGVPVIDTGVSGVNRRFYRLVPKL